MFVGSSLCSIGCTSSGHRASWPATPYESIGSPSTKTLERAHMKYNDDNYQRPLLQIKLENLLSFGPGTAPLELENLNILIGPNAAGKSNLIEALSLMRATPVSATSSNMDLRGVLRRGGGVNEWVWKGGKWKSASLDVVVNSPKGKPLRHVLSFRGDE